MTNASLTAQELVRRLLACGVREAVLSPGSRSGPIARALLAADGAGLVRLHVRVDEREAAFLALGMAKASGLITPVVVTSGTAVANLHPALLEAEHSTVPLVAVTADRPERLRGTGANQTTIQPGIFPHVGALHSIDDLVPDAVHRGPAHLNVELDEPLTESVDWDFEASADHSPTDVPDPTPFSVRTGPRTVVIAGDGAGPMARRAAEDGGWPLLAEPTSGARTGPALATHRLLLDQAPLASRIERVLSFGHATLSRSVTRLLSSELEIVHVGGQDTFPTRAGANVRFVDAVAIEGSGHDDVWLAEWREADAAVAASIAALADDRLELARAVWQAIPPQGLLWLGSSNPIRDVDLVATPHPPGERRKVLANRGLAGIDGTLSSAIGAALVRGPGLAYVGDLTFLHGSNGLLIGPDEPRPDLTIVVGNDDGGGIFAGLEQGSAEFADGFERIFGTPTGANIQRLCAGYGIPHVRAHPGEVSALLAEASNGLSVIEVPLDRGDRRAMAERISAAGRLALS